ncbi:MAG: hypothetical protein Q9202_003509 [Teloschistes flavicans]
MTSKDEPTYQPQDAISSSLHSTMILGGTGLFFSAVQNTLTRQNVSAWGVVTRTGSTIWTFAAIGGCYEFARTAAANLREKNDAYNNAIGGFFGGGVVGLRSRSFPAVLGFGAALSLAQFAFEYGGGKFSGFAQDAEVDEYERKEQLRRDRRRPIEQTLQEMGEGREIREQIEGLKAPGLDATARDIAIAECLARINDLTGEIGAQAHTTSHDQRTYNETLKALKDQLQKVRSDIAPRRKFAFRPTAGQAAAISTPNASETAPPSNGSAPLTEENLRRVAAESFDSSSGGYTKFPTPYANLHNVLRTERNLETADRGVFIAKCSRSVVRCLMPSVTLTITEVDRSLIVAGPINGAAHITGLNNSTIVVSCRQLRMHHCLNSIVYAIAPLRGVGPGWWNLIRDFNWLKEGQSPNWSALRPEDRSTAQTWEHVMEIGNDNEVEEVLPLFDVANECVESMAS